MRATPLLRLIAGVTVLLLAGCTVVDLDADGKPILPKDPNAKASYSTQTPQQVADETWQSKVMAAASGQALSWADAKTKSTTVKSGSSQSVFVQASGPVTAFNDSDSRSQTLTMTVNGEAVTVELGPVLRSNAIRDAAGFRFDDFTNQVQYAQLTRALNRKAVAQLPKVDNSWVGKTVAAQLAVELEAGKVSDVVALSLKQGAP